jgi:hypothetical protein
VPSAFADELVPALTIGAIMVAIGAADPAAAAHHRHLAEAGSRGRRMTRRGNSPQPIKRSLTYLPSVDTVVHRVLLSDYRIRGILGWLEVRGVPER